MFLRSTACVFVFTSVHTFQPGLSAADCGRILFKKAGAFIIEKPQRFFFSSCQTDGFFPTDCFSVPLSFAGLKTFQIVSIVL